MQESEKRIREELNKWSAIEETIYKQKSRIQWLKLGDSNSKFFHASMKGRKAQNQITMLTKADRTVIKEPNEIVTEVVGFYQQLLGQSISPILAANPAVLKEGPVLSGTPQVSLTQPFNREEVLDALKGIDDNKAPRGDGFNAHFFKQAWPIISEEVTNVMLIFCQNSEMYVPINRT